MSDFTIENCKQEIENYIDTHRRDDVNVILHSKDGEYILETKASKLTIIVNEKWIGCDLEVFNYVLGRAVGMTVDTDLYPIFGEYIDSSREIYDEVMRTLVAYLANDIFIGKIDNRAVFARPLNKDNYILKKYKRFSVQTQEIEKEKLISSPSLQRLFDYDKKTDRE